MLTPDWGEELPVCKDAGELAARLLAAGVQINRRW